MDSTQEHYSLRWNDHQNQILLAFDALLQTKSLVDVTLVCAETSIRAHKVVLSACSPFFQRVFAENPCKHPVIVLKDFSGWVVQAIVDFMYRGEISVPQERLQTLIQAGESLQIRGLIDHPVTGNTPTPAASPDDFNGLISNREGSFKGETTFLNHKLMFTPQIFMDGSGKHHKSVDGLCTSPMPRRKQARPRRRSGDFSPQNTCNGDQLSSEGDYDMENNKNYKNVDGDRADKESLSKSSSVLSLDTAGGEEPEDLCTKTLGIVDDLGAGDLRVNAKRKRASGQLENTGEHQDLEEQRKRVSSESAGAKRHSGNVGDKCPGDSRIVLSLKDIRNFSNTISESQKTRQLMASRFLNQSPNFILKTMSNHLAFNAAGGRLSPTSVGDGKFHPMQFRNPAADKFSANKLKDEEAEEQTREDEDEEEDQQHDEDNMDRDSADEAKKDSENGPVSSGREFKSQSHRDITSLEDKNNNNRLDLLMSMNGPSALLMDHLDYKQRQHMFQQQNNGLDVLKSGHHLSQNKSTPDLLADSRKNHNELTPVGNLHHNHHRTKDFSGTSPMSLPPPFNQQPGDAHPPFPPLPSVSSLALTPPHSK